MIRLYINDQLVELTDQSFILFNYTMDDLSNPTIVNNTYSQQISLPRTPRNERVFGHLSEETHVTTSGSFNALVRNPFTIYNEMGEKLESGYCKVEGVTTTEYKVSLYGGLGSYLYTLKYKSNGTEKTLADLTYKSGETSFTTKGMRPTAQVLKGAWEAMNRTTGGLFDIINWIPADNGYAEDFDCKHAIFDGSPSGEDYPYDWNNLRDDVKSGYGTRDDWGDLLLLEMQDSHKEWEMMDFRASRQRPAISIKAFLNAIADSVNVPGFNVTIDTEFLGSAIIRDLWMILPYPTDAKLPLELTKSPADYLIDLVKMFGLKILVGGDGTTISILTNTTFFTQEVVDLTGRVDVKARKDVKPYVADHRYYLFENEVNGEYASSYEERFGRAYGMKKVNTGYAFDEESVNLLENAVLKGAADAIDNNRNYCIGYGYTGGLSAPYCVPAANEASKYNVWKEEDGEWESESIDVPSNIHSHSWYDEETRGNLPFPLLQLRDESNKPIDASGILCLFTGSASLPTEDGDVDRWHISDDSELMLTINDGTPCYDLRIREGVETISAIPIFLRTDTYKAKSLEYGLPLETATKEDMEGVVPVYDDWWKRFIADRYDQDSSVMGVKVDLSGMKVDAGMLRRFYHIGGAIWSLNKISNHSLTTNDLTDCEFIKVKDVENYRLADEGEGGGGTEGKGYIQVNRRAFSFNYLAQTAQLVITSNRRWSITLSPSGSGLSLSQSSGGVDGETTSTTITLQVNYRSQYSSDQVWTIIVAGAGDSIDVSAVQYAKPAASINVARVVTADCIGCGECVVGGGCPVDAIHMTNEKAVIDESACLYCGWCFSVCPASAIITVEKQQ